MGEKKPLLVKTVCIAEPFTPQKERFRSHEVNVISLSSSVNMALEEFIKEIK